MTRRTLVDDRRRSRTGEEQEQHKYFRPAVLDILLTTLDTITDFTEYLSKKEALFRSEINIVAAGEEDLLAYYLKNIDESDKHYFAIPEGYNAVYIDEGHWDDFANSDERGAQLRANDVSYLWDALIETFSQHAIAGTHYYASHPGISNSEQIYRFLARESRTRRRMLARSLIELIEKTPLDNRAVRVTLPSRTGDPYYVFLLLPKPSYATLADYRDVRRSLLEVLCLVTKVRFPEAMDVIGIATETGTNSERSEDAIYFDASEWTADDEAEARKLQEDLGLLKNTNLSSATEYEYPPIHSSLGRGDVSNFSKKDSKARNKRCPCGSGKKFKHCHGREDWIT